jgi:hypothetical protein
MSEQVEVKKLPPCDVCRMEGIEKDAQYDARTLQGPWAFLCQECFDVIGPGRLGTGYGQKLVVRNG